jgi:hypothetical protein
MQKKQAFLGGGGAGMSVELVDNIVISDCHFQDNTALGVSSNGAAILFTICGPTIVRDSSFRNNSANGEVG